MTESYGQMWDVCVCCLGVCYAAQEPGVSQAGDVDESSATDLAIKMP